MCLERIEPTAGDCYFLPAASLTPLAPGVAGGRNSTIERYDLPPVDWNRLGTDGIATQLHIEQSLEAIDFRLAPWRLSARKLPATARESWWPATNSCSTLELCKADTIGGDHRAHILAVLAGKVPSPGDPAEAALGARRRHLLPAASAR